MDSKFYEQYEANAKAKANSVQDINPDTPIATGEQDFGGIEIGEDDNLDSVKEPEFKIDVQSLLRDLNLGTEVKYGKNGKIESGVSDDEMYCAGSFLDGRISVDQLSDTDAPYLVAAISHSLFGSKSDYGGTILANSLNIWDKGAKDFAKGYNPETKTWDSKTLLTHVKNAWDAIQDKTGLKKRAVLNADMIAHGWVKEGDKPFFSEEESDEQLDYQYEIAKAHTGNWDMLKLRDQNFAAGAGAGTGINTSIKGAFGLKDLWNNYSASVNRTLSAIGNKIIGDDSASVESGLLFHNANTESESDAYILRRAFDEFGLKNGDYQNLVKRIYDNDASHSVKLKNGTVLHVSDKNQNGNDASYIWVESGNDVELKMATINKFVDEQADSVGIVRMGNAMSLLAYNKDAAEGVALYMRGRKDDHILGSVGFHDYEGDTDALRSWANDYINAAVSDEDSVNRFNTVQIAMLAIQNMTQTEGWLGKGSWHSALTGTANLGATFVGSVKDMALGAYEYTSHKVERGIDMMKHANVQTDGNGRVMAVTFDEKNEEKSHREWMITQQIRAIASANINDEGTITGAVGQEILNFKAFELLFAARLSPIMSRCPGLRKAGAWLQKSNKSRLDKASKLGEELDNAIDDILGENMVLDADVIGEEGAVALEKATRLERAKAAQMNHIRELVGSERGAIIVDKCKRLLDQTPSLYTLFASSENNYEKEDAVRIGKLMLEQGEGFNDEMWAESTKWAEGRAVVSTSFMLGLRDFFKSLKGGSTANEDLRRTITELDSMCIEASKKTDTKTLTAIWGGFKVAAAELVESRVRPLARLGFSMGASDKLIANVEDISLGIKSASQFDDGAMEAGGVQMLTMGGTGGVMGIPRAVRLGGPLAIRNYEILMRTRQAQRPNDIISSIIATKPTDYTKTETAPDGTSVIKDDVEKAGSVFGGLLGEYRDAIISGDEKAMEDWRKNVKAACGEEGAKVFDALVGDLARAPKEVLKAFDLASAQAKFRADGVSRLLKAGGFNVSGARDLEDGSVEVDIGISFRTGDGKTTVTAPAKFLVKNGKIYAKSAGGVYAKEYVDSFKSEIDRIRNNPNATADEIALLAKYDSLTPEEKTKIDAGEDVNGILDSMTAKGYTMGKDVIGEGKDPNLVDVSNRTTYDGIVKLADGTDGKDIATVADLRHEMLGHGAFEMLRRAKLISDEDVKHLEETYGKNWEEDLARDIALVAGIRDDVLIAKVLGDARGGTVSKIKNVARSFLESIKVLKKSQGDPKTFDVGEFINSSLDIAHKQYKLMEERRLVDEAVRKKTAEEVARQQEEARRLRQEAEELYKKNLEERKRTGQEIAVQIAKQRDLVYGIKQTAEDIARKAFDALDKDIEKMTVDFDSESVTVDYGRTIDTIEKAYETSKRDLIQGLKKLGMSKENIGEIITKIVEPMLNRTLDAVQKEMKERSTAKAKEMFKANEAKKNEESRKADIKARADAFHEKKKLDALKKKQGERYAKQLSTAKKTFDALLEKVFENLRNLEDVSKFDHSCKSIMRQFKNQTSWIPSDITKAYHDMLKENIYQSRKAMEYKADGLREQRESAKAAEKAAKEAERAKKEEERKLQRSIDAALREQKRIERDEQRKKEAVARQKARDAKLIESGNRMIQMGMPVPNRNVIAGLEGDALAQKKEFMRQSGYYYSKECDCWVNKNAPKTFRKAASETVKKSVSDIMAVNEAIKNGADPASAAMLLDLINKASGRKTSDAPEGKKPQTPTKATKPEKAEKTDVDKIVAEQEQALRDLAVQQNWDDKELDRRIKMLRESAKNVTVKTDADKQQEIKDEIEAKARAKAQADADKAAQQAKPITSIKEEKEWWRNQLTADERLGLGVVYVDGKPYSIVYCPGEIISGDEYFQLEKGELPDGAEIRPFNAKSFEAALARMGDDIPYDRERMVTGSVEHGPYFDYKLRRINAQNRKETIERNKQERESKAKADAEQQIIKARDAARSEIIRLANEKRMIQEQMQMKPLTEKDVAGLNQAQIVEETNKYPYRGNVEAATKAMQSIDARLAEIQKTHGLTENSEEISGGIKSGHFCVSMNLEPNTVGRVEMILDAYSDYMKDALKEFYYKDDFFKKNKSPYSLFNELVRLSSASNNAFEYIKPIYGHLASVFVSINPATGDFVQEYPDTLKNERTYQNDIIDLFFRNGTQKVFEDKKKELSEFFTKREMFSVLDEDSTPMMTDAFYASDILGNDSPLVKKFWWLNTIPIRFVNKAFVGDGNDNLMGFFFETNFGTPFINIRMAKALDASVLVHEIQHAFQSYEKHGFFSYSGSKYSEYVSDMAENQAFASGNRVWFDANERTKNPFLKSSPVHPTEQNNGFGSKKKIGSLNVSSGDNTVNAEGFVRGDYWRDYVGGNFSVVLKSGAERLSRFNANRSEEEAKEYIDRISKDFVFGTGLGAMESILKTDAFKGRGGERAMIPLWMLNQKIESDGKDITVTLDNGVRLRPIWNGLGGNTIKSVRDAKKDDSLEGLRGQVVFEYAGDKAVIPHSFIAQYTADETRLADARLAEKQNKDKVRTSVKSAVVKIGEDGKPTTRSLAAFDKIEKTGAFAPEDVSVPQKEWTVADFFPTDKILETAYPEIYATTKVYVLGSERTKGIDGKPKSEEPIFTNDSLAGLDDSGNIYIKIDGTTKDKQVRVDGRREQQLVRDIGACLVKKILRSEGKTTNDGVPMSDVSGSRTTFTKMITSQRTKKDVANRSFELADDKTLRAMMRQVIEERFERMKAKGLMPKESLESVIDSMEKELSKAISNSFNEMIGERESIMFANRMGLTDEQLDEIGLSEGMLDNEKKAIVNPQDTSFLARERSRRYAEFYGNVLYRIDKMISEGTAEHKDRSLKNDFDSLLESYLLSQMVSRTNELKMKDPRLARLDGYVTALTSAVGSDRDTAGQREGGKLEEGGSMRTEVIGSTDVVDENKNLNDVEILPTTELPPEEPKTKDKVLEIVRAVHSKFNELKKGDSIDKVALVSTFATGTEFNKKLAKMVSDVYPKEKNPEGYAYEISKAVILNHMTGLRETNTEIAGRFRVGAGNNIEQDLIASVAAKCAYEKAKHRTTNIGTLADGMLESVKAQIMQMGVPEADAGNLAMSVIGSAKSVANGIVAEVDATVSDAQIIAKAKTKAANVRIGNDIYRAFKKAYRVGVDGVSAQDHARDIIRKNQLRAVKRAAGYSITELDSMLNTDVVNDLIHIGDAGYKYANGRDLANDMRTKFYVSFRNDNPEFANATDNELDSNPVFRAEFAATVSSWLIECAKNLSFGQERELAIRDAARIKNTLPPTIANILGAVEHHAEMLGKNLGKMNVEETLREIEKMIDSKPRIDASGNVIAGADGNKSNSEQQRLYERNILPRLQDYWKYVKEAMWFDKDKVDEEIERLQNEMNISDTDVVDIEGKSAHEITADALAKRDAAVMKINALRRYGALKERSAGEVMDVFNNGITKDLAYEAEQFLVNKQARLDHFKSVSKDLIEGLTKPIDEGKGWEDIGKVARWGRKFHYFNVPELFAKLESTFKLGSKAKEHIDKFRQDVSLAHEQRNRIASEFERVMLQDVKDVFGEDFDSFVRHACVPDAKYDRFSREGWTVPENGGTTVTVGTGRKYKHDNAKLGVKAGDEIKKTLTLAVPRGDARNDDPTHMNRHLSLANLIYIYAACRQPDMKMNNIIFGRDAAYIHDLENAIGAEGIAIADRMVRAYTNLRNYVSPVSERITGMPVMSPNELYVPLEFRMDKSSDRITRYSVNPFPNFLLNRRYHDTSRLREDVDIFSAYTRRAEDAAHYIAFGELADTTRMTIGSNKVVTQYHNLLGDKIAKSIFSQLAECFNGGKEEKGFGVGFRNFVTATTLGFNPSSAFKQLEGIGGWSVGMNPLAWMKAVVWDFPTSFMGNARIRNAINELHQTGYFKKNGLGMYERAEAVSEPMLMLMNAREGGTDKALNFYKKMKEAYREHSMDFIRGMDSFATHVVAGSYYADRTRFYEMKGETTDRAKQLALADFDYLVQIGQQSSRPEFLHEMQRSGIAGKMLTQFVGPTLVRAGVEIEALHRHFLVDRSQESFNRFFTKFLAGHVICPAILTLASQTATFLFGNRDDKNAGFWDDFATNLCISMAFGPMSGVFLWGQIANGFVENAAKDQGGLRGYSPRRKFEMPATAKFGSLADGLLRVTEDAATTIGLIYDGRNVNPMLIKQTQDDCAKILQQVFPVLRLWNVPKNVGNYIEKLERDNRKSR